VDVGASALDEGGPHRIRAFRGRLLCCRRALLVARGAARVRVRGGRPRRALGRQLCALDEPRPDAVDNVAPLVIRPQPLEGVCVKLRGP
jgi:hypothetical protein